MINLSWEDIEQDCKSLADKLFGEQEYRAVLGVARGGVVPALLVAKRLKITCFDVIGVSSYEGQVQKNSIHIVKPISGFVSDLCPYGENMLVIDDLADTGRTMENMRNLFPKAKFCVPYVKPNGMDTVDLFIKQFPQDEWLNFPWEKGEYEPTK